MQPGMGGIVRGGVGEVAGAGQEEHCGLVGSLHSVWCNGKPLGDFKQESNLIALSVLEDPRGCGVGRGW